MQVSLEAQLTRSPLPVTPGEGLNVAYQTAGHESDFVASHSSSEERAYLTFHRLCSCHHFAFSMLCQAKQRIRIGALAG